MELGDTHWVCSARCAWDVAWLSAGALLEKETVTVKVTSCFSQSCGKLLFWKKGVGRSRRSPEVFLK